MSKLKQLEELSNLLRGRKVVLANGCFDILHVGHLRYLQGARPLGDSLVVAINSDRSVKSIKEPGRPILDEKERVALVSALSCVDYIVLFDEPDVTRVIKVLRPAVNAKGTDCTESTVTERQQVLDYGGLVRITGVRAGDEAETDVRECDLVARGLGRERRGERAQRQ